MTVTRVEGAGGDSTRVPAVGAYALVALLGNITAVRLAIQIHRRLREQASAPAAAGERGAAERHAAAVLREDPREEEHP